MIDQKLKELLYQIDAKLTEMDSRIKNSEATLDLYRKSFMEADEEYQYEDFCTQYADLDKYKDFAKKYTMSSDDDYDFLKETFGKFKSMEKEDASLTLEDFIKGYTGEIDSLMSTFGVALPDEVIVEIVEDEKKVEGEEEDEKPLAIKDLSEDELAEIFREQMKENPIF